MTLLNRLLKIRSFFLVLVLSACTSQPKEFFLRDQEETLWTHLELGAGNYGKDGHTKKSQRMTTLMALMYVSSAHNFVDQLNERDPCLYDPKYQYAVLFWTLDRLVERYGTKGVFHINDLFEEYAQYAVEQLSKYAHEKGYHDILIQAVPGDYTKICPSQTLKLFQRTKYDSVHLKNPEVSFYHVAMDGDNMYTNVQGRNQARKRLQKLANLSDNGLYFFSIYTGNNFIPEIEKKEFINKGIFYRETNAWGPVPYYFPEGTTIDIKHGKVYYIESNQEFNQDDCQ
ncbi:hypothetical protein [Candidatus Nucleicultrix amoebiphila]|jgi:hypothetical protein|uniref:Lipoprotein n=1 Tax=Candidatus Nucleicultrix amoebiphila FS5 TaxID=1414854 RepID=A0A1W6N4E1_9PROT|nr:hypothetical protein [Candidatus Nucleicultrix amoebiphila]ARN84649.1 hypothetical protein GQ61_04240 [Candidatus Nucleicultrix amoebiphila FS5]